MCQWIEVEEYIEYIYSLWFKNNIHQKYIAMAQPVKRQALMLLSLSSIPNATSIFVISC